MAKPNNLFSSEFLILNFVFFVAAIATAVFFQLHQYLRFLGISQSWSGFIIAADALPALVLQPLLGVFLNNFNSRKWMLLGTICMVAALLSYQYATSVATLVLVRTFQGAGFACLVAALMVMVVEHIPPQKSGSAFGIISTIISVNPALAGYQLLP